MPLYAEGDRKLDHKPAFEASDEKGSALHPGESQREAIKRIYDRVWNVMIPRKQPYDLKCREVEDAYIGLVKEAKTNQESKVFPLVFMLVDSKLSVILANRPKAVFEIQSERKKIPMIEHAYNHYTTDVDDGVNLEATDHLWHWYNELYGWAIKRVWHEVDTEVGYESVPMKDEQGKYVYGTDGFVRLEHHRCIRRKARIKHRVYDYDKVAVDPTAKFLYQADDIVFFEDIHFNEFEQQYKFNPAYENTEFVHAGTYYDHRQATDTTRGVDSSGNAATVFAGAAKLDLDYVRIEEYYGKSRCEYMLKANGIPILHVPNPTPYNELPAADLHNRLVPKTFYDMGEGHLQETFVSIYQKLLNAKSRRAQLAAAPVVLTDNISGLTPKSVKVYPGAHWKGMKGRVEVLDLSGQDTGEVTEYLLEIRNLMKIVSGNDFERMVAEPDPTAEQQAERDAASRIRPEKDIRLQENLGHVRSMRLTVDLIQNRLTIPELAELSEVPEDERDEIPKRDRLKGGMYNKYPKIRTVGLRYVEFFDTQKEQYNLKSDTKNKGDGYLFLRPDFVKTKDRVRVRITSNRSHTQNKQTQFNMQSQLMEQAFTLPPKNQAEIEQAIAMQAQPPRPEYFINREAAVEGYLATVGADVQKYTAPEGKDMKKKVAERSIRKMIENRKTMVPDPSELPRASEPDLPKKPIPDILPDEAL